MIGRGIAKGAFLTISAASAVALALGVYQVPQPWRGVVIVWLLVGAPLLFFVLRVLRHAAQLKTAGPRGDTPPRALPTAKPARPHQHLDNLRIVVSDSAGSGRFTLR